MNMMNIRYNNETYFLKQVMKIHKVSVESTRITGHDKALSLELSPKPNLRAPAVYENQGAPHHIDQNLRKKPSKFPTFFPQQNHSYSCIMLYFIVAL